MPPPTTLDTAPTLEPVMMADVKEYLHITSDDEHNVIADLIKAARNYVENHTHRALITQTWLAYWGGFKDPLVLPYPPLQSVTHVKYYDLDGTQQTLGTSVYSVNTDAEPGRIHLAYNQSWPSVRSIPNTIEIKYVCGYGDDPHDIPPALRTAIKLLVGHWFEHREAVMVAPGLTEVPMAVKHLLWQYRMWGAY